MYYDTFILLGNFSNERRIKKYVYTIVPLWSVSAEIMYLYVRNPYNMWLYTLVLNWRVKLKTPPNWVA